MISLCEKMQMILNFEVFVGSGERLKFSSTIYCFCMEKIKNLRDCLKTGRVDSRP
jgi:hypothetical protein